MARRSRGELEEQVLAVVHAAQRPASVAEVVAELEGEPAYTTVMTTLTRLWSKGALVRQAHGRGYTYAPVGALEDTAPAQTARTMRRLLDAEGRRTDVLARFVAELDPADEQYLLSVLRGGAGDTASTPGAAAESPADTAHADRSPGN